MTPHTLSPRAHLLSNGSYAVMVTNAGGGYSRRQQTGADAMARGHHARRLGQLLLRPRPRAAATSGRRRTSRPAREADEYEVIFALDRAVFRRVDGEIETRTEIVVSPEDDAELRRVSITNHEPAPAQHRADQLRRGRAGARRRGPGAPGVLQSVRRNASRARIATRCICAPPPALGQRPRRTSFTC